MRGSRFLFPCVAIGIVWRPKGWPLRTQVERKRSLSCWRKSSAFEIYQLMLTTDAGDITAEAGQRLRPAAIGDTVPFAQVQDIFCWPIVVISHAHLRFVGWRGHRPEGCFYSNCSH